jgi:hypothetical protein
VATTTQAAKTSAGKPSGQQRPAAARPQPAATASAASAQLQKAALSGPPKVTLDPIAAKIAPDEIDLSTGELQVPDQTAETVKDGGELETKVRLPGLAEGTLKVRKRGGTFHTAAPQGILLRHPALARFTAANPTVLALTVKESKVSGFVGLGLPGQVKGNNYSLLTTMSKSADLLNWAGLTNLGFPAVRNQFVNGVIDVGVDKLSFTVGGFLSGSGSVALDNKTISFDGSAKIAIPGGSGGELNIKKDPSGELSGKLDIIVQIGSVTGTVQATLSKGFVSIMGSVAYSGDRLSGKVTLVATDEATARDVTLLKPSGGDVPIELPGPDKPAKPGKRAFCGWGTLTFRVTDWLAGSATVIVNSKGQATIVGEIAPPKEFFLFGLKQPKEWVKRIFKLEVKAGYGIPVVGQVGIFASIALDAIAKLGPAKLYNIKLSGAYSTDPRVAKNLTIEASLNISAFAGLRLRAEAGLVVTILGHDIKAGVGVTAIAGVRGYVEATPRIGMRELAPGGKREYFIQGHLEIAAQPVLGFSGDLFVAIETPWWSPLSDKRWTWPLGSIEYPLPGEFGIGADVDYVLGSAGLPKIEFGEVNFDSSKFMTDVMNDNTDSGSGKEEKKPGDWEEGLGAVGKGGAKNKGGSGKKPGELDGDSEPVGASLSFSDGKESHRLWFAESSGTATLMVATQEAEVPARLTALDGEVKYLLEGDRAGAGLLIRKARELLPTIKDEAKQVAALKEAERRAEETYKKYGKSKGKKGKKENRKEKNKRLKSDEGKLEEILKNLFSLMRMEPWEDIKQPASWAASVRGQGVAGKEQVEIIGGEKMARLRLANAKGVAALVAAQHGPLGATRNPAGREAVKAAGDKILVEDTALRKVPIAGDKVQSRAKVELTKMAGRISPEIAKLGKTLKVANLQEATKIVRMAEWPVKFNVNATPEKKYQENFKLEMETQLRDQEQALNLLTVDTWVARIDTYKSKFLKVFTSLDDNARKAVAAEIRAKLADTEPTADQESLLLIIARENLKKFLDEHGDFSKLTKKEKKHYYRLERLVKEAEAVAPARALLKAFLQQHGDLTKLTPKEQEEFARLSKAAKVVGRSGQEEEFQRLHAEGIRELSEDEQVKKRWEGLKVWGKTNYALLHNPDQVAGGHGTIADLTPVKQPTKPTTPNEADEKKYQEDLKAWEKYKADLSKFVGQKWINSIIGGGWGSKIPSLRQEITKAANYTAPTFGLWLMHFKLGYAFTKK